LVGVALCILSIFSAQFGSALSATAIDDYGAGGAAFLRFAIAAAILALIVRPPLLKYSGEQWLAAVMLGAAMAVMTTCFFSSIQRLPLGLAVAIDFLGPLAVAAVALSGWRLIWPGAALIGVLMLSHDGANWVGDPIGVLFALGAGAGWAAYIILLKRSSNLFHGLEGLSVSLITAAVFTLPVGLSGAAVALSPEGLGLLLGLAVLVPLIPYALETTALRRMPMGVFSILMSLEPAVAALAGLVILGQPMSPLQAVGTALVVGASVGVTTAAAKPD
jgi:inner membrane transporter RhtA